jgi:hypothetical protein
VALDWLPVYPDPVHKRSQVSRQTFSTVSNFIPIPIPPPPTELTWHPTYPDRMRIRRRQTPDLQQSFALWLGPDGVDVRWLPHFPDTLKRSKLSVTQRQFYADPNYGEQANIPIRGGWRPSFPAFIQRKRRVPEGGEVYVTPPLVILDGVGCIQFVDESLLTSTLIDDSTLSSTLIDESLTISTLSAEDVC